MRRERKLSRKPIQAKPDVKPKRLNAPKNRQTMQPRWPPKSRKHAKKLKRKRLLPSDKLDAHLDLKGSASAKILRIGVGSPAFST